MDGRGKSWWGWTAFAVLCGVAGSRWIFADAWPQGNTTLRSEAWACAVGAVMMAVVALARRRIGPSGRSVLAMLLVGAGLLGAPSLGAALHGPASEALNRTVALCFVPVIVAVLSGISGEGESVSLWPGLAGLGGVLLVFPLELPSGVLDYVGLLLPPLAIGAACIACGRMARGVAAEWSAALLLGGGAACLGLLESGRRFVGGGGEVQAFSLGAIGLDLLVAALTVLIVLQMNVFRYASSYLAIPLLTIVEGVFVLRMGETWRVGAGVALLAIGCVALWRVRGTAGGTSVFHLE